MDASNQPAQIDASNLPAPIGACAFCHLPLYADAPIGPVLPDRELLSHVACAVDATRR